MFQRSGEGIKYVRFEVFTAVAMKKAVFWDVVLTDVSEERIASIFRLEGKIRKSACEETVRTGASRLILE
jgi:hypothetical protein